MCSDTHKIGLLVRLILASPCSVGPHQTCPSPALPEISVGLVIAAFAEGDAASLSTG